MMCEEMIFEYWFSTIRKLSARKKYLLRELIGTGKKIYYIEETEIAGIEFLTEKEKEGLKKARKEKTKEQLKEEFCEMQEHGIKFIPFFSKEYPPGLAEIPDPPYALFVKGTCPGAPKRAAIVGARGCSGYGEHYTREFAEALAAAGVDIISGMAKGIDGTGQRAALNAGGKSYAVLGSGVDVCYPRDHIGLYMDIIEHGGGILSEFPPGTPPLAMNFPMRNRIISGLSDAVLVMEARLRSGSLITADMALEQGKDVYALPGSLDSPLSAGCNQLIQQGAGILLNPENLLEEWGIETNVLCRNTEIKNEKNKKVLESTDDLVYAAACRNDDVVGIDRLARAAARRLHDDALAQRAIEHEIDAAVAEEHVDALGTQVVLQRKVELLRLFGAEVADGAVDELQACANGAAADDADLIGVGHALHMGVRAEFQIDLVRIVNEGLGKVRADEVREIAADLVVQ